MIDLTVSVVSADVEWVIVYFIVVVFVVLCVNVVWVEDGELCFVVCDASKRGMLEIRGGSRGRPLLRMAWM